MSPKMPLDAPTVTASPKMKVPTEPATADRTYTARKMSPPKICMFRDDQCSSCMRPAASGAGESGV